MLRLHAYDSHTHNVVSALSNWLYNNPEKRGPDHYYREVHDLCGPTEGAPDEEDTQFKAPEYYPPLCLDVMRLFWYTMMKGSVLGTTVQPQVRACLVFGNGLNHYH